MTYTTDSPAVKRAVETWTNTRALSLAPTLAVILDEHKTTLQAIIAGQAKTIAELTAERDELIVEGLELRSRIREVNGRLAAAQSVPAAVVLPEITDEDTDAFRCAYYRGVRVIPWGELGDFTRENWRHAVRTLRDRLAASLPVWQPVEPGTVIRAGTRYRTEWDDDSDGVTAVEKASGRDFAIDPTDPGRFFIDPRTVPAEPVDPDAAAIATMADEAWRVIGEFPGLDITFQAGTDDDRDLCELIARAALAAYRQHIDKEA